MYHAIILQECGILTDSFNTFANRADPDLVALAPTQVDLCLFDSLRPINNLSFKHGQVFLG